VLLLAEASRAQTFDDVTTVRNPVLPYGQLFQLEAGVLGAYVDGPSVPANGLEDKIAWDGRVFYHDDSFGAQSSQLDAYVGRDGIVASLRDGRVVGDTSSRLQLSARLWQFYRDGYYQDGSFVPVGQYEGRDYDVYLGFGREADEGLFVEFGPYYGRKDFERTDRTEPLFSVPDDYDVYGGRLFLEQSTLQLDRRKGLPRRGYLLTLVGEREWNDSSLPIGSALFQTELPDAAWRARGRLEWYIPQASDSAWEIFANGWLTDEKDRVVNSEAQHPQGSLWVDAQLRLRLPLGDSFLVTPYVQGQYLRILNETGTNSDREYFFGGGLETWLHFSQSISMHAYYSYLDNDSRPSVSISEDAHGQHMFFAGFVLRFGSSRR